MIRAKITIILITVLTINIVIGQPGFNQWYGFDTGAAFHNIIHKEDTLVIAGTILNQETDQWGALFLKMDTLGNILWEWESEEAEEHLVRGIQQAENGDWIYSTRSYHAIDDLYYYLLPKVVRRDSNFNLLWEYELAQSQSTHNETIDFMPAPGGGEWLGIGNWALPDNYTQQNPGTDPYIGGCQYKISGVGDSLWVHCDTGYVEQGYALSHSLGGMTVLPGGSMVSVGSFTARDSATGFSRPVGWVIKRDKHGCMEELCVLSGLEDLEEKEQPQLKV